MPKPKKDVKPTEPSTVIEPDPIEPEPTPTEPGEPPVVEPEPQEPPAVDDEGVPYKNRAAEFERKLQDKEAENEKLMDTIHDALEKPPVAPAPQPILPLTEADYKRGEDMGLTREQVDFNVTLLDRYDRTYIIPDQQRSRERQDLTDTERIVSSDATLKPYDKEIAKELKDHPTDTVERVAETIKGRHMDDIIKQVKSDARKEADKNRRIISETPSGATVTVEGETYDLTAAQKAIVDAYNASEDGPKMTYEQFAKSAKRHKTRKEQEHNI